MAEIDLIRQNTRKIIDLQNRQFVNQSHKAIEASQLKGEGSILKAVRGKIESNVPIDAPNLPDNLDKRLEAIADSQEELGKRIGTMEPVVDEVRLRLDEQMEIYDIEDTYTATGIITTATIPTSLNVYGTVVGDNISYDNEARLSAVEKRIDDIAPKSEINIANTMDELEAKTLMWDVSVLEENGPKVVIEIENNTPLLTLTVNTAYNVLINNEQAASLTSEAMSIEKKYADTLILKSINAGCVSFYYINDNYAYSSEIRFKDLYKLEGDSAYIISKSRKDTTNLLTSLCLTLDLIYPVGSIYTSMNPVNPARLFGIGTWEQITDRFLYCASSSGETGGSKKISVDQLPAHSHAFTGNEVYGQIGFRRGSENTETVGDVSGVFSLSKNAGSQWKNTYNLDSNTHKIDRIIMRFNPSGTISSTGNGDDYMPPYMTVYAWYRIA